jgi:hypothetical protein
LPNLEFLIRNTVLKLSNWNHTIVCGNINYDFIKNICENICKNINSKINIIKLDIDNLNPSQYIITLREISDFSKEMSVFSKEISIFSKEISIFLKEIF